MDIYVLCEQVLHTNTTSYNEFGLYKKKKKSLVYLLKRVMEKKDSGMFKLEEEGHIQKQEIERLRTKKLNSLKGCRVDTSKYALLQKRGCTS